MKRMTLLVLIGLVTVTAAGSGCTPYATHPRVDGSMQVTTPRTYPVPDLMAKAITFAQEHYTRGHELVINLPADSTPEVYADVIKLLGSGRPMKSAEEPAIHVEAVRVRAFDAEVDVIYPQPGGHYEFITVYMKRGLVAHYDVTDTRLWRVRTQPPAPRYQPVEIASQPTDSLLQ